VALLEDDTGMELLVCNKIVSLDLPVKDVFKKIWCAHSNHGDCMRVVYRMRGLLGDATEDMVEKLDDGKDKNVDEEQEFKMAAVLSRCEGLDAVMWRLGCVRDFIQGHQLISAALKLLDCCIKLEVNRQYLLQPHLNTVNTLLAVFNLAVDYEDQHNTKLGADVCEQVLEVTEKILQEASSNRPVLTRSLSQPGVGEEGSESQLMTFLEHISAKFVQSNPSVRDRLLQIIPFLTFGDVDNMNTLLDYFSPHLDFDQFDAQVSPETRTYFDCFCVVTNGIGSDPSGNKLKELIMEKGITSSIVNYLQTKVPAKLTSVDSPEWQHCLSLPSVSYVLRMLAGLCKQHAETQVAAISAVEKVHLLEQVSTEKHLGTLAENVLETMMENAECQREIKAVRKATREEKKRKAMALRKKELGALGMQLNEKGQVVAISQLLNELGSLEEETGLKCCICLEGYRSHPQKVLGVYTFSKKVTLDEFESKPRKTMGICTVSHFNVVHYDCHSSAVKLARGRDEWESAMLQNANTRCNGLMPIWGPNITDSSFASSLARHTSYLQESTSIFDPSFLILAHDIRLLLLRFAYEKSFSAESGGGGPQSNLHLVPYLMHIAIYVLNTTRAFQKEENSLATFLSAPLDKWVASSYELDGPLYAVVVSLFIQTLAQWKEHRLAFLRRLLILAHTRKSSSSLVKTFSNSEPVEYAVYKPVVVLFGLVDGLHHMLKAKVTVEGSDLPHAVLDYIRNNDVAILEGCDKMLSKYQEELLTAESFEEVCDVLGLLGEIDQPSAFLTELLASVSQK
jgi:E3 ubiquitin-protein ligase UBR4